MGEGIMTRELGSDPGDHGRVATRMETVVIGAGQAGLATGFHLARRGRDFVILDAGERVGDNWRCHWDSLRLYSPARRAALPGMRFPAPPMSYPTKDEMADFLTIRTPLGRKMRPEVRAHGGPLIRVKRDDLARVGVEMAPARTVGVRDGLPVLDGGRVLDVANLIWCTGFQQDFSWIDPPVTGGDGWPVEVRGVVPSSPGLYFAGLAFQCGFASMLVGGAGRDAAYVVKHLCARTPAARRIDSVLGAPADGRIGGQGGPEEPPSDRFGKSPTIDHVSSS
jgi:choline dehydrogenase-like flavoprotein